ncbi:site-specific recombinase xerd [Halorubrum coriense DSM 10284]|uniref:Site-specific recombinase xerd n=1 Tax=Halorubrum coriense DSM 10284 TaxID=1227466 RepID=M0ELB5_9EURY|nr:site-specific integrase [Halorubrum coriense]ELZ47893.1 site-specific recombinase xerd [Halorubrum coriense DSM 10284]
MTTDDSERYSIDLDDGRSLKIVPETNREELNEKQLVDYVGYRRRWIKWLREQGKHPQKREGYSDYTVYETAYKSARFDRWVWADEDRYTIPPTGEHASEYIDDDVVYRDVSNSTKGKIEEALTRYMRWVAQTSHVAEWEHDQLFSSGGGDAPRDYLTRRERRLVREQALAEDDGWKIASIVCVSLDAGLRPVEVGRARTEWVDIVNRVLRIPREDSSKNADNWRVSITSRTATALENWLEEREDIDKYADTDALWLTRESTTYNSRALARLLRRLFDEADIEAGGRDVTWLAIRHSTGTYMTQERDLAATQAQLRHQSAQTTLKYDQVPPEQRRDALDKM